MPLVTNTVPNMIGGVAQTPPTIRQPNQCEVQENAVSSIVDGLSKRPPAQHVSALKETGGSHIGSTDGMIVHTINRDTTERYFVSVDNNDGTGTVRVHDIDGNAKTVYTDGSTYLSDDMADGANPADQFDFLTVADVTFIVNKNKKVEYSADLSTYSRQGSGDNGDPWPAGGGSAEALLWVNKTDYSTTYKVHIDGDIAAQYTTPDGVNSDVSIGSVALKFIDVGGGSSSLVGDTLTLKALDPNGKYIHTRTYKFVAEADTNNGKFVDTDLNYKGALDIAKVRDGEILEPGTTGNGTVSNGDMYEFVADMAEDSEILLNLGADISGGISKWDTDDGGGGGYAAMDVSPGTMIYWNTNRWSLVSADNQRIRVAINGTTTAAGVATLLQDAILSDNGHRGLFAARLTNEDDVAAGNGTAAKTNNILTISQTKSGHLGNTLITTDVVAADMVDFDTGAVPTQFTGGAFSDGVGDEPEDLEAGTIKVAEQLSSQLNALSDYTTMQSGSVIYIHKTDDTDINITIEEDGGGENLKLLKRSVQLFTDLPPVAPKDFIIEITGAVEKDIDNYYVKFDTDGTEDSGSSNWMGTGKWIETVKPGIKYKLDPAKMPHVLLAQKNTDGTLHSFYFKKADGATPGSNLPAGAAADIYDKYGWHNRLVGDEATNLDPSFVNYKINAISLFKGRLVFLSDENVIFSETSVFWNFFRLKTTLLTDSDRIDVAPSGEKVSILRNMVGYNDRLVVSSDQTQFAIKGNPMVTATGISITPITDFETLQNCPPVRLGTSLFYGFKRGGFSGLREVYVTNGVDLAFGSLDLTETVPAYIPGNIRQIAGSTHEGVVCVLSDDSSSLNKMYIYNYDQRGQQRVLSSWSTFTSSCTKIESVDFIDSTLYLVVRRAEGLFLEKIDLSSGLKDTNVAYITNLDRRIQYASGTGPGVSATYDSATDKTTFNLPYNIESGATMQVVSDYGPTSSDAAGYVYTISSQTTNTILVTGDLTSKNVFVGESYTMTYQFTKISMKESSETTNAVTQLMGRHQLRYGEVTFADTGYFKVQVTPTNKDTSTYTYTGKQLGSITARLGGSEPLSSGSFRFPVFSKSEEVKIEIINDSPFPSKLISTSFEALWQPRIASRRRY